MLRCSSDVAMLYNDKAVLENHHVSAAFRLMRDDEFNIVANLKREEYRWVRADWSFKCVGAGLSEISLCMWIDKYKYEFCSKLSKLEL